MKLNLVILGCITAWCLASNAASTQPEIQWNYPEDRDPDLVTLELHSFANTGDAEYLSGHSASEIHAGYDADGNIRMSLILAFREQPYYNPGGYLYVMAIRFYSREGDRISETVTALGNHLNRKTLPDSYTKIKSALLRLPQNKLPFNNNRDVDRFYGVTKAGNRIVTKCPLKIDYYVKGEDLGKIQGIEPTCSRFSELPLDSRGS